jgi:anaerobic magnesium-protoporphyrin IX monomethyl ester cyclase
VIQLDQTKWDYKHQVLATRHVPPWRVFLWVKGMELVMQARPRALWRLLTLSGAKIRRAQRWYYQMGRRVWFHEVFGFFFRDKRVKHGPSVEQFWGATLAHEEEALARPHAGQRRQLLPRPASPASG